MWLSRCLRVPHKVLLQKETFYLWGHFINVKREVYSHRQQPCLEHFHQSCDLTGCWWLLVWSKIKWWKLQIITHTNTPESYRWVFHMFSLWGLNDKSWLISWRQIFVFLSSDIELLPSTIGQNFTYQCKYNQDASTCIKFICKGEDSTVCKQLVTSTEPDVNQRFIMKENNGSIIITVREVTANDSGIYWCGARVPHKHNQTHDDFFDGFHLTVGKLCCLLCGWLSRSTLQRKYVTF